MKRVGAVGAVLLALLLWFLFQRGRHRPHAKPKDAPVAELPRVVPKAAPSSDAPPPPPRKTPPALVATPPETPIIDSITVEKPQVCRGEENLVTVKAHTPDGKEDGYLHVVIAGGLGTSVPVIRDLGKTDDTITVFGRNNVAVNAQIPYYQVVDCHPPRKLALSARLLPNTNDTFEITAHPDDGPEPTIYRWSFGDGTTDETSIPVTEHSFAARSEDSWYSYELVKCEAVIGKDTVVGRMSLPIMNHAFEDFTQKGIVRIDSELSPRFPELRNDGVVEEQVHLFHHRKDTITVTKVTLERLPSGKTEEVDAAGLLGATTIPAGDGIVATVDLDTNAEPDTTGFNYYVEGESSDGWPAHGNFSVLKPPPKITPETATPVSDPMLAAKILRAQEVLHKQSVTDEDLLQLEHEGVFSDLKPIDGYVPPAGGPPPLPK